MLAGTGCADKASKTWQAPVVTHVPAEQAQAARPTTVRVDDRLPLDGMVGQVNGHAIYAKTVLEELHPTLQRMAANERPRVFEETARQIIAGRLTMVVTDRLLLGEAERDLNEHEHRMLRHMVQKRREELLRQLGGSSQMLAEQEAMRRHGKTLDELLEDYRATMLVRRLMMLKVDPKIHVRRRDVEKYYHDNPQKYNAPPVRSLRLILARENMADEIDRLLAEGKPFVEVASNERLNSRQPQTGGMFIEDDPGDVFFGDEQVDQAILALNAGEHTGRVTINNRPAWVYVDKLEQGVSRTPREAQLEIEQILREQQRQMLTLQYRDEIFERGSYTSIEEMTERVLAIAKARYLMPKTVAGQ